MSEEMDQQALENSMGRTYQPGEPVDGTVIQVNDKNVYIDIGYKSEGVIDIQEFAESPRVDDTVTALFTSNENEEGNCVLSKAGYERNHLWSKMEAMIADREPVKGRITRAVNKGFIVSLGEGKTGIEGFLPQSQIPPEERHKQGETLDFCILEMEPKRKKVILSRKQFLTDEQKRNTVKFLESRSVGETVEGEIKTILDYGAFIQVDDGVDGFLHKNDVSWGHVANVKDHFKKGDKVEAQIILLDRENQKIGLGVKQLQQDPWERVNEAYPEGSTVNGVVTKIKDFGAFVRLEDGVEGLLHISDLSWTKKIKHPKEVLSVGQEISVKVLDIKSGERRISLGMKQMEDDPWSTVDQRFAVGDIVEVKVVKIIRNGVFAELDEGIEGYIKNDDFSWHHDHRDKDVKEGVRLKAQILSIDKANKKIALGVKQTTDNPWSVFKSKFPKGSIVDGKVSKITDFGAFVQVDENIEGLIHISQASTRKIDDLNDVFTVGDTVRAVVTKVDEKALRIALSVKELHTREEREMIGKYVARDVKNTDTPFERLLKNSDEAKNA